MLTVAPGCGPSESTPATGSRDPNRPNVIVLLVDTLRADHLGVYGYERDTSPNLDRFARDATVFRSATAQAPWTVPSVTSLMTSLYPSSHGLGTQQGGDEVRSLDPSVHTLAEALGEAGYRTGGFVTNPWVTTEVGLDRGFDTFHGFDTFRQTGTPPRAAPLNEAALGWLDQIGEQPFFLYLHYMDVHGPYNPPPPFDQSFVSDLSDATALTSKQFNILAKYYLLFDGLRFLEQLIDRYDGEIRYWDHHFGRFLESLEARRALENSVVIVVSDHGEEFLDHGGFNHGQALYEEHVHVPLIWRMPSPGDFEQDISRRVQVIDVMPTLLSILGLSPATVPGAPELQGRDLLPSMTGKEQTDEPSFSETDVPKGDLPGRSGTFRAVLSGRHKLIRNLDTSQLELYDLGADPDEKSPLGTDESGPHRALVERMELWVEENRRIAETITSPTVTLPDEVSAQLEALGYLESEPEKP